MGNIWVICIFAMLIPQILADYYTLGMEDEMAKDLVLGGNYGPHGFEDIVDMHDFRRENQPPGILPINNTIEKDEEVASSEPAPGSFSAIQKFYEANYIKVIETAGKNLKPSDSGKFQDKVKGCASHLENCTKDSLDGPSCYIRCLSEGERLLAPLYNVVHNRLFDLCNPLHTVYSEIFKDLGKGFPWLRTYPRFLSVLGVGIEDFERVIPQLGDALIVAIIDHGYTNLIPLRRVTAELQIALGIQQREKKFMTINNPGCRVLQMYDPAESIMEAFYRDSSTMDILLPGFAMFSSVSKYFSSRITQDMAVLRETMRLFTGTAAGFTCGDIEEAGGEGGGGGGNCDELGKYPLPGFPVPPAAGVPNFVSLLNPVCSPLLRNSTSKETGKPGKGEGGSGSNGVTEKPVGPLPGPRPTEEPEEPEPEPPADEPESDKSDRRRRKRGNKKHGKVHIPKQ